MAISFTNFDNYLNSVLDAFVKDNPLGQTITDKPVLRKLQGLKKTFVGGADYVTGPARFRFASDYAAFATWYSHLDTVSYAHTDDILRWKYAWRECHMGMTFDYTEFKQRGVEITEGTANTRGSAKEVQTVKDWAKSELEDNFGESQSRFLNDSIWGDGTQSAKAIIGITGILDENPAAGTIGNISRATYAAWRHQCWTGDNGLVSNPGSMAASLALKQKVRQQRKYGGMPDCAFAGSRALDLLEAEVIGKVSLNQDLQGVTSNGKTTLGSPDLYLRGVGPIEWDPWLDDHNRSDFIYVMDSRHMLLRPMDGEWLKVQKPERPYDQYALLKAVTATMALVFDMLNCHGVYQIK